MESLLEQQAEVLAHHVPEFLNHIYLKQMALAQNELGLDEDNAKKMAVLACQMLVQDFGGEVIYVPKNSVLQFSTRDLQIYEEFNGNNHRELCRKYNVSLPWVYKIVKRMHKQAMSKHQPDLFAV